MKKILSYMLLATTGLLMAACSDDYKDWKAQQTYEEETITIPGFSASATPVDLNTSEDLVKIISLNGTLPEGATIQHIRFVPTIQGVEGDMIKAADKVDMFAKSDLQTLVADAYGKRPVAREIEAHVYADLMIDGQGAYLDAGKCTLTITPEAPVISKAYYLVGGKLDWKESAVNKVNKLYRSEKDPYEDPIYTTTMETAGDQTWFAFGSEEACDAIAADDWNQLFGTKGDSKDLSGKFDYRYVLGGEHSFCVETDKKYVKIVLNMLDYTYQFTPFNPSKNYYLIGGPGKWDNSKTQKFTQNGTEYTYEFAGSGEDMWFAFGDEEAIDAVGDGTWNKLFGTLGDSKDLHGSFDWRYNIGQDNSFCVDGKAKKYVITIDVVKMTYKIEAQN